MSCNMFLKLKVLENISICHQLSFYFEVSRFGIIVIYSSSNIKSCYPEQFNSYRPDPGGQEKINLSFYFYTSLWPI